MRLRSKATLTAVACALLLTSLRADAAVIAEIEADGTAANNTLSVAQGIAPSAFTLPVPAGVFSPPGYATATVQGSGGFRTLTSFVSSHPAGEFCWTWTTALQPSIPL